MHLRILLYIIVNLNYFENNDFGKVYNLKYQLSTLVRLGCLMNSSFYFGSEYSISVILKSENAF